MRESQPLAVELEHTRIERLRQSILEPSTDDAFDQRGGRIGERGDDAHDPEPRGRETCQALLEQLVEVGRDRQILARSEDATPPLESRAELERKERVATRRLPDR